LLTSQKFALRYWLPFRCMSYLRIVWTG